MTYEEASAIFWKRYNEAVPLVHARIEGMVKVTETLLEHPAIQVIENGYLLEGLNPETIRMIAYGSARMPERWLERALQQGAEGPFVWIVRENVSTFLAGPTFMVRMRAGFRGETIVNMPVDVAKKNPYTGEIGPVTKKTMPVSIQGDVISRAPPISKDPTFCDAELKAICQRCGAALSMGHQRITLETSVGLLEIPFRKDPKLGPNDFWLKRCDSGAYEVIYGYEREGFPENPSAQ